MTTTEARPAFIPDWASNVKEIGEGTGLWLWEFSGGAVVCLGTDFETGVMLELGTLGPLLQHFHEHEDRYLQELVNEDACRASYEDHLRGQLDYEEDEAV